MKKIITISVLFSIICTGAIVMKSNPIIVKYIFGSARMLDTEIESQVFIGGRYQKNARIFKSTANFDSNQIQDEIILYLRDVNEFDYPVLIVDRKSKKVLIPNSSVKDYNVIFNQLFQSQSGSNIKIDIRNDIKSLGIDPNLKIQSNQISFIVFSHKKAYQIKINLA